MASTSTTESHAAQQTEEQDPPPPVATAVQHEDDEHFVQITELFAAGLSLEENPQHFFRRSGFKLLSKFVDKIVKGCHIGLVDGLPGTGKSSTLWWKLRQLDKRSLLWIHFDRLGAISDVVKAEGTSLREHKHQLEIFVRHFESQGTGAATSSAVEPSPCCRPIVFGFAMQGLARLANN